MLLEIDNLLDDEHKTIKEVLCSFAKVGSLDTQNAKFRIKGNLEKLAKIYEKPNFRHQYSQIFVILSNIDKNNTLSLDYLIEALKIAVTFASNTPKDFSLNFMKSFYKLHDHINLEILQLKSMKEIEVKTIDTKKDLDKVYRLVDEANQNVRNSQDKLNNMQKEYITILGIFASIVLAFVAGFSFSNSVLSNIHQVNIYKLSFIICLIGIFITNILYFLFSFIKDINYEINKEKFFSKHRLILVFNLIICLVIICICLSYYYLNNITK